MTFQSLMRPMMISKIHRATVTQADLHYVGSITIDAALMEAADLLPGQRVDVLDVTNGNRLTTYAIPGTHGTGQVCINGAAAHHIHPGDIIIVLAYGYLADSEARTYAPAVVFVDSQNQVVKVGCEPGEVPADSDLKRSGRQISEFHESGWPGYKG